MSDAFPLVNIRVETIIFVLLERNIKQIQQALALLQLGKSIEHQTSDIRNQCSDLETNSGTRQLQVGL